MMPGRFYYFWDFVLKQRPHPAENRKKPLKKRVISSPVAPENSVFSQPAIDTIKEPEAE